jgi:hypothetical protein
MNKNYPFGQNLKSLKSTEKDSSLGFWLRWHPSLFIRAQDPLLVNRESLARRPNGLMKILGASFAKFPILEPFSVGHYETSPLVNPVVS